ncbi:MAG TPA: hypothetical protein VFD67_00205, partial [Gemmatimonadaceae bacterium]|nr:hypothetical protein [Gemmatimonadaceae bacterium]
MRLRLVCLLLVLGCAQASAPPATAPSRSRYPGNLQSARPLTRAERSNFTETSHYTDVVQFIDSLRIL